MEDEKKNTPYPPIALSMPVSDLIRTVGGGDTGGVSVLRSLVEYFGNDSKSFLHTLFDLDDMNLRGQYLWIAFKEYCKQDVEILVENVEARSSGMVHHVNSFTGRHPQDIRSVREYGASTTRHPQ